MMGLVRFIKQASAAKIFHNASSLTCFFNRKIWLLCEEETIRRTIGGTAKTLTREDQFSRSVVSDSLRPHELQHARPPCPSPIPGVHSNSRPSRQWCHPAISSSVVPFSSREDGGMECGSYGGGSEYSSLGISFDALIIFLFRVTVSLPEAVFLWEFVL